MIQAGLLIIYFALVFSVVIFSYKKQKSDTDFVIGNRSLNFWLTALSAHASDMSSWLFLAYPAMVYAQGVFGAWSAIGLTLGMFLSWQFVAPPLRTATEQGNNLTINSYFETRFRDSSGALRIISALMSVLFYTFYITSGLVGLGLLVEGLLDIPYLSGISIGLIIVVLYVFAGGYRTIAYIDLFQGLFLLAVILFIPLFTLYQLGGFDPILQAMRIKGLSSSLFPQFPHSLWAIFLAASAWGLGYFGQPHILTKFMGIRRVSELSKAKWLGIGWQATALGAATLIGLIGIFFFPDGLADPETMILNITEGTLPLVFSGLVLCAIVAATTNVMAAQILVVATNLSEDFYKKILRKTASHQELLWVSRGSVLLISLIAFIIAYFKISTIYELVLYSWSGLGASFGPLILLSLYRKHINRYGAFLGILVGGLTAALWPYIQTAYELQIPALVAGFFLSILAIEVGSFLTRSLCTHK